MHDVNQLLGWSLPVFCFCLAARLLKPETKSGQLCLESSLQPHMEPSFEQEPAEKQHQTTCASVSQGGSGAFHAVGMMRCRVQSKRYLSGPGCWSREWTGSWRRWWIPKSTTSSGHRWRGWCGSFCRREAVQRSRRPRRLQRSPNQRTALSSKVQGRTVNVLAK